MLYLDIKISGQFPAGIRQLDFVRCCSFCQLLPKEISLKVFCQPKVLNVIKLEKQFSAAVSK